MTCQECEIKLGMGENDAEHSGIVRGVPAAGGRSAIERRGFAGDASAPANALGVGAGCGCCNRDCGWAVEDRAYGEAA